jgi:hypothetical protein
MSLYGNRVSHILANREFRLVNALRDIWFTGSPAPFARKSVRFARMLLRADVAQVRIGENQPFFRRSSRPRFSLSPRRRQP